MDMNKTGRKATALELAYARAIMANNEIEAQRIKRELEALLNTTQMPEVIA
jgi:hypothetical protein